MTAIRKLGLSLGMVALVASLALGALLVPPPVPALGRALAQATARIDIEIRHNGHAGGATGSWEVRRQNGSIAARGSSAGSTRVAPGAYRVVVMIDGVLDRPTRTFPVTLAAGGNERVQADFATGTLVVSVTRGGQRAAAMVEIVRDGQRVATLASGVRGTLSTGSYVLRARHRGETRETTMIVRAGAELTAELAFP